VWDWKDFDYARRCQNYFLSEENQALLNHNGMNDPRKDVRGRTVFATLAKGASFVVLASGKAKKILVSSNFPMRSIGPPKEALATIRYALGMKENSWAGQLLTHTPLLTGTSYRS
jgi:hypothetical protein